MAMGCRSGITSHVKVGSRGDMTVLTDVPAAIIVIVLACLCRTPSGTTTFEATVHSQAASDVIPQATHVLLSHRVTGSTSRGA